MLLRRACRRRLLPWLASASIAIVVNLPMVTDVDAHGEFAPKHRGLMNNDQGETAFELVSRGKQVVLHLEDHGEPISTEGARGTISVNGNTAQHSAALLGGGGNRLAGRLLKPLQKGDRAVVNVIFRNGSIAEGQFLLKQ